MFAPSDSPDGVTISVAVATLDRPDGLRRCLEALLQGERRPDEILVVDQGGLPETREVVRNFDGGSVRHVLQSRRGLAASRNLAIRLARGQVLAVTDDDCRPGDGWVAAIAADFARDPLLAAVCGPMVPNGDPRAGYHAVSSRTETRRLEFHAPVAPWRVGTGANFAARRDVLDAVGGYDERLGTGSPGQAAEDVDLLYRLLARGRRVVFDPAAHVSHALQRSEYRWRTRWTYGFGVGAMVGLAARRREGASLRVLGQWLALRGRLLGAAALARRSRGVWEELTVLAGTGRGLAYGLTAGPGRRAFDGASDSDNSPA